MAQIPMAADVAALIGEFAEKAENRSLLLDKFVFHKSWPVERDDRGQDVKWDDASRWSFMRISNASQALLLADATKKEQEARGRNVAPAKALRLRDHAAIARRLSNVTWNDDELAELRARHTRRFLGLLSQALPGRHTIVVAQLEARLAINLSDSLIQNAGICLDRLFGLPYIPGSAVKGVCRHAALEELKAVTTEDDRKKAFHHFREVFGTSEVDFSAQAKKQGELANYVRYTDDEIGQTVKGSVDFLPAYPVNHADITVDLTTVHYPDYYHSGRIEDLSKENPRPNPFPVVEQGARFAFCLVTNGMSDQQAGSAHLESARRWLELALTQQGMGAKTASGYGWFSIPADGLVKLEAADQREREAQARDEQRQREAEEVAAQRRVAQEAEAARVAQKKELEERRKTLSPEQIADETVAAWNDDAFRARMSNFIKRKGAPSDEEKKALVRACRGARISIWNEWKVSAAKGGETAKIADAIRVLSKQLNLGKMP